MTYKISSRTKKIAKTLGVQVFPSDNKKYKMEVYDYHGNFITYVGASCYRDFPAYLEMESRGEVPKGYAEKRRQLYWKRHSKEIEKLGEDWEGSRSYYSMALLWS